MEHLIKGNGIVVKENVSIGKAVILEDDVYIDSGAIIRDHVHIKRGTYIGSQCILGEYTGDFFSDRKARSHPLVIGEESVIRSGTIIYGDSTIGSNFQTGHRATIREKNQIGHHVRIGTLSDIQHSCQIGNYVNLHSNVFLGEETEIEDYVWLFPGVTVTNDPTPPSNTIQGVKIQSYASIAARALLLPGVTIGSHSLVGAGAVVTKNVPEKAVVVGNPAKKVADIDEIKSRDTKNSTYPWPLHFSRGMPWETVGFEEWLKEQQTDDEGGRNGR